MAFEDFLLASSGKTATWIYNVSLGSVQKRYVAGSRDITFDGQIYEKSKLSHSRPKITDVIEDTITDIIFPRTDAFAKSFLTASSEVTSVSIRRFYRQDPDEEAVYAFRGHVVSATPSFTSITLRCGGTITRLGTKAISQVIQRPCRHVLYGRGCGLDRTAFEDTLTATDWTAPVLTVTGADAQPNGYYTGGICRFDTNLRWITSHSGTSISLDQPVLGLDEQIDDFGSATVFLAPGCDRTRSTCNSRFGNILNHGGFDWMTGDVYDGRDPFT